MQQLHDVYDSMVMTVARVGRDQVELRHALRDAVHHLAHAIPFLDDPDRCAAEVTWFAAHEAYLSVIALARAVASARGDGLGAGTPAYATAIAVLDALAPFVTAADRGLRRAVLDDEPLAAVVHRMMSA